MLIVGWQAGLGSASPPLTLSVPDGAATLGRATTTLRILDTPR